MQSTNNPLKTRGFWLFNTFWILFMSFVLSGCEKEDGKLDKALDFRTKHFCEVMWKNDPEKAATIPACTIPPAAHGF